MPCLSRASVHVATTPAGPVAFLGALTRRLSQNRCSQKGGLGRVYVIMAATASAAEARKARKAKARADQLAKAEEKARKEKEYFDECRRKAASNNRVTCVKSKWAANNEESECFAISERQSPKSGSPGINFEKYNDVKVNLKGPGSDEVIPLDEFQSLGTQIPAFLLNNISQMGYRQPTPIQKYAVPLALSGSDLMCCAQTGSGKTAAFLMPLCAALAASEVHPTNNAARPRALILAPTRELALQIHSEATKLCNQSGMRSVAVYGGANQRKQIEELALGSDIVIATPGRLDDFLFRSKIVQLRSIEFLVLDEADRMLDMGFEPQLLRIVEGSDMPSKTQRQTLLFSATFPGQMQVIAQKYLSSHVWVGVGRVGAAVDGISQSVLKADSDKRLKLKQVADLLSKDPKENAIVFVNTKARASWIKKMLCKRGASDAVPDEKFLPIMADEIHGGKSQSHRERVLEAFRAGHCRVLVATDVAARGLDIPNVGHVINMDLPSMADFESFVHRIGRTGRAGRLGRATSLFVPSHEAKWGNLDVARPLVNVLREANQDVPEWLEQLSNSTQAFT